MAKLGEFLFGSPNKMEQFSQFSPEQQQFFEQMFGQLGEGGQLGQGYGQSISNLQQMMDPSSQAQQAFADPYMQQFEQQTVPGLAERFAGAGALGGGLSSSGFGQAIGGAGANLQSNLAQLKSQLQQQAGGDLMNQYNQMSGMGMNAQPFGYTQQQAQPGLFQNLASGWAGGGFQGGGSLFEQMFGGGGAMGGGRR